MLAGTVVPNGIVNMSCWSSPQSAGTLGTVPGVTTIPDPLGGAKETVNDSPGVKCLSGSGSFRVPL
jgi:hypothetical protein